MKLGDDADEIDLDVTLERYDLTKDFLLKILDQFCKDHSIKLSSLLSDGARDRLVLASGGVARDYLSITRRSIDVTRQRLASDDRFRGIRISAEDANKASGELENFKFQDFERDVTAEEVEELKRSFERVRDFCVEKINCNCFLVNKDAKGSGVESIRELVDLKLIHHVNSRVTVRDKPKKIFEAYMLDLSQYSGERKRRNLDLIEFWRKEGQEKLRRSKLIYLDT